MSNNKLQQILDDNALTQAELRKETKLSTGLVNKACRGKIVPKLKSQEIITAAINNLLATKQIQRRFARSDIF